MKYITSYFLILLYLSTVYAQDFKISVSGNSRTKYSFIKALIKDCAQTKNTIEESLTVVEVEQCLINSKVFSKVSVGKKINHFQIKVEERWTLIPVPMISSSGESSSFGLFLFDSHFLGSGKKAGIGGSFSSEGNSFFLMYNDPKIFHSIWTGKVIFARSSTELVANKKKQEVFGYKMKSLFSKISLGISPTPLTSISMGIGMNSLTYETYANYTAPPSYQGTFIEPEMFYSNQQFKFYFNEGLFIKTSFLKQIKRDDDNKLVSSFKTLLSYDFNITNDHALQLAVSNLTFFDSTVKDTDYQGGAKGTRGITRNALWIKQLSTLSFDYQIPFKEKPYGTWTVAPFIDYGLVDSIVETQTLKSFYAYGIGTYLYMRQIALPGIGIIVGHNNEFEDNFFSVSIGMRMN